MMTNQSIFLLLRRRGYHHHHHYHHQQQQHGLITLTVRNMGGMKPIPNTSSMVIISNNPILSEPLINSNKIKNKQRISSSSSSYYNTTHNKSLFGIHNHHFSTSSSSSSIQPKQQPQPTDNNDDQSSTIDSRIYPVIASSLLSGIAVGVVFPVMPIFARDLGLSPSDFGLIISMIGVTRLVFNIPSAWAADKYGRRFTLVGGPFLSSLGMLVMASANSLTGLLGSRFLTGVGGSMQMTGAQMYLSDISTAKNRARTMAPMGIAFATGATIGPALGGWMADAAGLRAPFYFVALATFLVSYSNYRLVPETRKFLLEPGQQQLQLLLHDSNNNNNNKSPQNNKSTSLKEEFQLMSSQWRPLLQDQRMRSVLTMHLTYWSVQSGCTWTLLPMMAHENFQLSTSSLGSMFALMSCVGIICMKPAAWVSDKFGRKLAVVPASALLAASLACMPFAQSHEQLLALIVTSSIGATFFQATPQAYVADISSEQTRGQALALLRSAGDAGLLIGASSFGLFSQLTNVHVTFGIGSVILLSASLNFALRKDIGNQVIGIVVGPGNNNGSNSAGVGGNTLLSDVKTTTVTTTSVTAAAAAAAAAAVAEVSSKEDKSLPL
jgi:DHA1 family multidrug resistance protein-like MFS transporter